MAVKLFSSFQARKPLFNGDAGRLPDYILYLIFGFVCAGVLFHFVRQREIFTYTLQDAVFDKIKFDRDLYSNSIRRIIHQSAESADNQHFNLTAANRRKKVTVSLCKGITHRPDRTAIPTELMTMKDIERFNTDVSHGGSWKPINCTARFRVAIIIPYRDRYPHLVKLLATLIPILKQQNIHFKIYLTEQFGNFTFNKGVLMNAAFKMALWENPWQCFVFHDVDMIPENVRNMYTCPTHPRHMSASVDEFAYNLPAVLENLVGGVFAIKTEHFRLVNGYSNSYWGWGAEDDDMSQRLLKNGFRISRPPYHIARYKMVKHTKATHNPYRFIIYSKNLKVSQLDGLNNLNYSLIRKTETPLYTNFLIDVGRPPNVWYFPKS